MRAGEEEMAERRGRTGCGAAGGMAMLMAMEWVQWMEKRQLGRTEQERAAAAEG